MNIINQGKKSKILIVDDSENITNVLAEYLIQFGYNIIKAVSGIIALKYLKKEDIGVMITDIRMPGFDGLELLKKTKEISPSTEVILMTGFASVESAVMAVNLGAYSYLKKPFNNLNDVRQNLERALERRELRIRNEELLKELTAKVEELNNTNKILQETRDKLIEEEKLATKSRLIVSLNHEIISKTQAIIAAMSYLRLKSKKENIEIFMNDYLKVEKEAMEISNIIKSLEKQTKLPVTKYVGLEEMIDINYQKESIQKPKE